MRHTLLCLLLLASPMAFTPGCGRTAPTTPADDVKPPEGFQALFNGKDLSGWHGMPQFNPYEWEAMAPDKRQALLEKWAKDAGEHWTVEKGELVNDGDGPYMTTDKEFGDIELLIEYKTVPKADSGIYLRATPQVQIWDYTKEGGKWARGADKGSGGLFNNARTAPGRDPLVLADKPFGQWNSFRILQVGERTTVYLNGKLVVNHARMANFWNRKLPLRRKGPIQLQTHGGEIRWRNIFVREIPPAEANEILRKHGSKGFKTVFNGKDFTGWDGATTNYEVKDGAIACQPRKGGNIFTRDTYADFVARVEYRLPPGGNNGLAIRYPGTGNAAYVGMTEIQILDDTAEKYAKLDKRQYNGSSYGMVPCHRGYLRPVGEWNFMEVTVRGPTIQVELNGTRILDADLSKVKEFMANSPHPGKDRTEGHFGFCGHGDAVAFRNIQIKRLEKK
jgi:hypothetical protein